MQRNNAQRLLPALPDYDALHVGIATIKSRYKGVNLNRMELISLLETVDAYVQSQAEMSTEQKREMLLAAYVFGLERIEAERWIGQGSSMRDSMYSVLGINNLSAIDNASRLILLNQFGRFVATDAGQTFLIARASLANRVKSIQSDLVWRLKPEIKQIKHALPTESTLDAQMTHVVEDYLRLKKLPDAQLNQQRLLSAQLLQSIALLNPGHAKEADLFSPSYRVKMGALLFVMRDIGSANSKLYQLCQAMLNIRHPDDIHPELEKICLLALRNSLTEKDTSIALEMKGRETFGAQNKLVNLEVKLDKIIRSINVETAVSESSLSKLSTLSMILAGIGGVILAAPGYGSGQALGTTVAQTDFAVQPTKFVASNMHMPIRLCLGGVGNYVGNFAATMVINNTLESAFGFAIGALGFTLGATTGAVVGFTIFQVTPALIRKICELCLDMHTQIADPVLADKVDRRMLEALMLLPDDVFSLQGKNDLKYVTGVGLFAQPSAASAAQAANADAVAQQGSLLRQSNGV